MTSVYGVTFVGAREQMKRRLQEKGLINDEQLLFTAACYAAKVSFSHVIRPMLAVRKCNSLFNVFFLSLHH